MESVLMAIELNFLFSGHGSSMVSPMHRQIVGYHANMDWIRLAVKK